MRQKQETSEYLDEFNEEFLKTFSDQASKITYMVEYQEQKQTKLQINASLGVMSSQIGHCSVAVILDHSNVVHGAC